ncbi:MAG: hypothetical protein Q9170_000744 [Blastenia crenularia]
MAHLVLTGCTGTTGAAVLARCIGSPTIAKVSVLSRRPIKQAEGKEKVKVYIHEDFNSYPDSLLSSLKGAIGCVWALGISTSQVKATLLLYSEYNVITLDYPLAAAKAFASLSPSFNFVYVSGEGVTRSPGRFTPLFSRVKGEAETSLLALRSEHPGLSIWNARPAFIDESQHPLKEGPSPWPKRLADRASPVWRAVWPNGVSPTGPLAGVLVRCAQETESKEDIKGDMGGSGLVIEEGETTGVLLTNVGIRRLAGL